LPLEELLFDLEDGRSYTGHGRAVDVADVASVELPDDFSIDGVELTVSIHVSLAE
jgi:hypothetical protein